MPEPSTCRSAALAQFPHPRRLRYARSLQWPVLYRAADGRGADAAVDRLARLSMGRVVGDDTALKQTIHQLTTREPPLRPRRGRHLGELDVVDDDGPRLDCLEADEM